MTDATAPALFLIAGEPSGDALGGALMRAIERRRPGAYRFIGVGGEAMAEAGLTSQFPMEELSIIDFVEVLRRYPALLGRLRQTVAAVRSTKPAALITIDCPRFSLRVSKAVGDLAIPRIHYVAPTVWAHGAHRAAGIAAFLDHLLLLYPFERPYFDAVGLDTSYVGPPVLESGAAGGDGPAFRQRFGIAPEQPLLCVLPGSRRGELERTLPVFRETLARLAGRGGDLRIVVPTVPAVEPVVRAAVADWPAMPIVVADRAGRYDAMAASTAALAQAGTVTLELAAAGLPAIVAGLVAPSTAWWLRLRRHTIRFVAMPNWLAGREIVPEFVQEACRPDALAEAVARLLGDDAARRRQRSDLAAVMASLAGDGTLPSDRAAAAVLAVLSARRPETK